MAALESGGDPCTVAALDPVIWFPALRNTELGVTGFTTDARLRYTHDWSGGDVFAITIHEVDGPVVARALIDRWSDERWAVHYHLKGIGWERDRIHSPARTPR